ncbi:hypothetical protein M407DRAFT_25547 [Tulasnella calospora MUT 4182]|uniref:F-box domain-containing protein n=1 Tax=Tulasnella calospora MUT 4182 TaxID=1051891 RepID=A0A0C3QHB7_9AGAM|nr:hypothetical protein M407DRAFT_25547 [Tulasnella calospora MUT 4182]
MRLVGKRWQEIIDGTPTLWTSVLLAYVPPHANEMTILRSNNRPLSVVYEPGPQGKQPPVKDFLATIAHTHSRWSTYSGPIVPEYLETPGPLLQTIDLWSGFEEESGVEPWELLGGSTTALRHVALHQVSIGWKIGMFVRLKSLTLDRVELKWSGLRTSYILDFLRASPGLEHLRLQWLRTSIPIEDTLPSFIITLPELQSIRLHDCQNSVTEPVLQHIRAPSCSNFSLTVDEWTSEEVARRLMDEALLPFQGVLRTIHERLGGSQICLGFPGFSWYTPRLSDKEHRFNVSLGSAALMIAMRWVKGLLGPNPSSLSIYFQTGFKDAILETIAPTRRVTKVFIEAYNGRDEALQILNFLAKPLLTNPSLPSLPCLREIVLISLDWSAQEPLDCVHSRCDSPFYDTVERPLLVIKMSRGWFSNGSPRPVLDYAVLTKIREHKGVERVEFFGSKERDGMVADFDFSCL